MMNLRQKIELLSKKSKELEKFDSFVFVEIPQPQVRTSFDYRIWLSNLEKQ